MGLCESPLPGFWPCPAEFSEKFACLLCKTCPQAYKAISFRLATLALREPFGRIAVHLRISGRETF